MTKSFYIKGSLCGIKAFASPHDINAQLFVNNDGENIIYYVQLLKQILQIFTCNNNISFLINLKFLNYDKINLYTR